MAWTIEHDWIELIHIRDDEGSVVLTLEKHASGVPGSGIPVDTHGKAQTARAERIVAARDITVA